MQRKLNEEFIKEYIEEFSEKIISSFFDQQTTISGKEILNLTPSKQVNLFVLKILFRKWQEEMKQLESPYFDYKATEVRKAMVQFMNTLSQHIQVSEDHLKPMLEQALADTLVLASDPGGYFALILDELDVSMVTEKVAKPLLKYIRIHKSEIQDFFDGNLDLPQDEFIDAADDYFEDLDVSVALMEELGLLSEVLPIAEEQLFEDEESEEEVLSVDDEFEETSDQEIQGNTSFFDQEMEDEDETDSIEENSSSDFEATSDDFDPASEQVEEDEENGEDDFDDEVIDDQEEDEDDGDDFDEQEDEQPGDPGEEDLTDGEESPEDTEDAEPEEEQGDDSINSKYNAPSVTVNDNFGKQEKETLSDQLEKRKVNSIMDAISVNHRYMFTKELFDGDRYAFTQAIGELESADSFDGAVEKLVNTYAKDLSWDMNSEEVKELLKVVFRRFR